MHLFALSSTSEFEFEFLISQGSVATCLRWCEYCRMGFVANFIRFPAVQKFWKSVDLTKLQTVKRWKLFIRHSVVLLSRIVAICVHLTLLGLRCDALCVINGDTVLHVNSTMGVGISINVFRCNLIDHLV